MKLSELLLDRNLYRDNNQSSQTQDSAFVSLNSSEIEPTPITSGGAAQDINTGNVTIDGAQLTPGTYPVTVLDVSNWGWGQTCAFSSTDSDTVSWGAGVFTSADGNAYNISAGNTGNMSAKTYIYLDLTVSDTVYQTTTTPATAVGVGKVLIAVAENAAVSATFMMSEATQIVGDNIIANTINASKIQAGTVAVDVYLSVGSGNAIFKADTNGIYLGNATFASAPFSANMDGDVVVASLRRKDFHWYTIFESIDGYTKSGGTQSATGSGIDIQTGNTISTACTTTKSIYAGASNQFSWAKRRSLKVCLVYTDSVADQHTSITNGVLTQANPTGIGMGFAMNNGNLLGFNADGVGYTQTSLNTTLVANTVYTLEFVFTPGVDIKYYVNNTLKATVTTRLPAASDSYSGDIFNVYLINDVADNKHLTISYYDLWQAN